MVVLPVQQSDPNRVTIAQLLGRVEPSEPTANNDDVSILQRHLEGGFYLPSSTIPSVRSWRVRAVHQSSSCA